MDKYKRLENGIKKQTEIINKKCEYNIKYSSTYNDYGEKGRILSHMRLSFLLASIKKIPNSILDIGYGNGDFLNACTRCISSCNGSDISKYPLSKEINMIDFQDISKQHFDVVCFFDSLEHFDDINFIKHLECDYIFITLPWCHFYSEEWFMDWKHRRPDEHLWHFNKEALLKFFKENGYEKINCGIPFEDIIRKDDRYKPNILTGIFKKTI